MKRKRLFLTGFGEILKESAEKRLENQENAVPRCDAGHTREFYEDLNVGEDRIPQELKDREKAFEVEDEDFEEIYTEIMVYLDDIKLAVTDRGLTTVFLNDDLTITVTETVDEIDSYIDYLEMTRFDHIKADFNYFIRRIKIKLGIIKIKNFAEKEINTEEN